MTACHHLKLNSHQALLNMNPSYFLFYLTDMNSTTLGKRGSIHQVSCFLPANLFAWPFLLPQPPPSHARAACSFPRSDGREPLHSPHHFRTWFLVYGILAVRLALALSAEALIPTYQALKKAAPYLCLVLVRLPTVPAAWAISRSSALELHLLLLLTMLSASSHKCLNFELFHSSAGNNLC